MISSRAPLTLLVAGLVTGLTATPAAAMTVLSALGSGAGGGGGGGGVPPMLVIALIGGGIGLLRFVLSVQATTRAFRGRSGIGAGVEADGSFEDRIAARMRELDADKPIPDSMRPAARPAPAPAPAAASPAPTIAVRRPPAATGTGGFGRRGL